MENFFINMPEIIVDVLSRIDSKLVLHCERIAYMIMNFSQKYTNLNNDEICKLTWTSLFHDIGLFHKVDNENWDDTENESKFSHSEYGYLFLKQFSPFSKYATIVRHHHASWNQINQITGLSQELKKIIKVIKIIDQIDLYRMKCQQLNITENHEVIDEFNNGHFSFDIFQQIKSISLDKDLSDRKKIHKSIMQKLEEIRVSETEKEAMLQTLISAIDFRSRCTAIHCSIAVKVSDKIGEFANLTELEKQKLHIGTMLHDLGKISIPLNILESEDKLYDEDWEIMKSHVNISEEILKNRVDEDILNIAIRHHETLDGKGYPYQISDEHLTICEKIASIADIISALSEERSYKKPFSNEKIINILKDLSTNNKICGDIVEIVEKNQQIIFDTAKQANKDAVAIYDNMITEYNLNKNRITTVI